MIIEMYLRVMDALRKQRLRLWGLSLLVLLAAVLAGVLFGLIPGIYLALLLLLEASTAKLFLRAYRGETPRGLQLFTTFSGAKEVLHVLGGMALAEFKIFLWSLIPIVGPVFGCIRACEYALVPYILTVEPEVGAEESLQLSQKRMEGYKWSLFAAAVLPVPVFLAAALLLALLGQVPVIGGLFLLLLVLLCLVFSLCIAVFELLLGAAYYDEIRNPTLDIQKVKRQKLCPACQKPTRASHKFCPHCGTPLSGEALTVIEAENPEKSAAETEEALPVPVAETVECDQSACDSGESAEKASEDVTAEETVEAVEEKAAEMEETSEAGAFVVEEAHDEISAFREAEEISETGVLSGETEEETIE